MTPLYLWLVIVAASFVVLGAFYMLGEWQQDRLHAHYGAEPERPRLTLVQGYKRPVDWAHDHEFDPTWREGA